MQKFCRLKNVPSWNISAIDFQVWRSCLPKGFEIFQALKLIEGNFRIFPFVTRLTLTLTSPDVLLVGKLSIQIPLPALLGWRRKEGLAAGWKISVQVVGFFFPRTFLTAVRSPETLRIPLRIHFQRKAGQRDTSANVGAARRDGGLDLAVVWASMRVKLAASLRHPPACSMPRSLHLRMTCSRLPSNNNGIITSR